MDYEKAYKDALLRAKGIHQFSSDIAEIKRMEQIFPELKESDEEKIRKAILNYFTKCWGNCKDDVCGIHVEDVITWLEKQDKVDTVSYEVAENEKREFVGDGFIKCYADFQDFKEGETYWLEYVSNDNYNVRSDNLLGKMYHITPCQLYTIFKKQTWLEKQDSVQSIKPKFHKGEWITNGDYIWKIVEVKPLDYILQSQDDNIVDDTISHVDEQFHSFTIEDAKDGDVLAYVTDEEDVWIMIYWSLYEPYEGHVHYHALLVNDDFSDKGTCCICINDLKPATKEQRDLLFQKMKEAGWEFDFDKKELKKFHIIDEGKDEMDYCFTKMMNGEKVSSTWSEEDDYHWMLCLECVEECATQRREDFSKTIDWLKSCKQKMEAQ